MGGHIISCLIKGEKVSNRGGNEEGSNTHSISIDGDFF